MLLALSVENTYVVMGIFEEGQLRFTSRMTTDRLRTGDEYAISLDSVLTLHGIRREELTGGIISSVVPTVLRQLREAVCLILGKEPLVVGPGVKTGLNILMDNPATLGADLVCSAAAAIAEYPMPLIVVQLDTATTLLCVDGAGNYVGSVIAPGAAVSGAALSDACDQLPRVGMEAPGAVIGKNTVDCMRSGLVFGTAAMVDGLIDRVEDQLGGSCTLVATGSLAETILPHCAHRLTLDPVLLLKGLERIYERNRQPRRDRTGREPHAQQ